jgi:hypothetical protein
MLGAGSLVPTTVTRLPIGPARPGSGTYPPMAISLDHWGKSHAVLSFARVLSVPANASLFLCATASHSRCGGLDSIAVVWKTKKRKETETIENTVV